LTQGCASVTLAVKLGVLDAKQSSSHTRSSAHHSNLAASIWLLHAAAAGGDDRRVGRRVARLSGDENRRSLGVGFRNDRAAVQPANPGVPLKEFMVLLGYCSGGDLHGEMVREQAKGGLRVTRGASEWSVPELPSPSAISVWYRSVIRASSVVPTVVGMCREGVIPTLAPR
jgi:hypothetical protein